MIRFQLELYTNKELQFQQKKSVVFNWAASTSASIAMNNNR